MEAVIVDREIICASEVWMIRTGRDLDLKKDLEFSKDPYNMEWEQRTYITLKRMYVDEGIIWRAIKGRYDIDRGGARLLRRHLTIVGQIDKFDKIWKLLK